MKNLLSAFFLAGAIASASAATTINLTNNFAYGANLGWLNWRGDITSGAVIGEYVCYDYIYSANVGWIHLGNGMPTNGVQYMNLSAADYGVNHDGAGNLRGYAWSANVGWITFESIGDPSVDLATGNLSGYIYSANCGWISLSNAFAHVQTDSISSGLDMDGDGMPDAWEQLNFGGLSASAGGDPDGDGASNLQEFLAGTNPNDATDVLRITSYTIAPGGTTATMTWQSVTNRNYRLEKTLSLKKPSVWIDSGLGVIPPTGSTTTATISDTNAPVRFYRVRAVRSSSP